MRPSTHSDPDPASPPAPLAGVRRAQQVALLSVVLLASYLRFSGLDSGLRHPLHTDERVYVENVVKMVDAGDLDHRFYTYPGLFFYLLAPGVALLDPGLRGGPDAYLVSRFLVAAFGVFNVALVAYVGRRLLTPTVGLVAALFMAVSPLDVRTPHEVRPDVILETFGLLALLALAKVGPRTRDDARVGLLIGLAASVKFTGLLLVPAYVARRLLQPGKRFTGLLAAGATTIAVALLCTPYSLIHASEYRHGPPRQLHQYYPGTGGLSYLEKVAFFVEAAWTALGPIAFPLVIAGAFLCLRSSWRFWGPALLHPIVTLGMMSTGALVFPRYVLPAMGLVDLLAAVPLAQVAGQRRWVAMLVTAAAVVVPLRSSLGFARYVSKPSAQDRALDWIDRHVSPGSRILETRHDADPGGRGGSLVGIDPVRFEFLQVSAGEDRIGLRLLAPEMDLILTGPAGEGGAWTAGLQTVYEARGPAGDLVLRLKRPIEPPVYRRVDLSLARIRVSDNPEASTALADDDLQTAWTTGAPMRGGEWIEVDFGTPVAVGRIELVTDRLPVGHDPEIAIWTSQDGHAFVTTRSIHGRPEMRRQLGGVRPSQLLLLPPRPIRILRIEQLGARPEPWTLSALRIDVRAPPP